MTKRGIRRLAALAGIVTIGAAVLIGAFVVRSSMRQQRIERAYAQGMTLYEAEDYETALPQLGTAIAGIKDDPELLKAYAVSRAAVPMPNRNHLPRAIAAAKAAVTVAPSDDEAKEILLGLYRDALYLTELVDLADRMLAEDPSLYEPRTYRIEALRFLGRDPEAMEDADALVEYHPDRLEAHTRWDSVASRNGRSDLVRVTRARELRSQFEDDPEYLAWLSKLEALAGNTDAAVAAARDAAAEPPVSAEQVSNLVDWLRDLHRTMVARNPDAELDSPTLMELADGLFARALADEKLGPAVAGQATRRTWWANRTDQAREYATRIGAEPDSREAWWASLVMIGDQPSLGKPIDSAEVASLARTVTEDDWSVLLQSMNLLRSGENETVARSLADFISEDAEARAVADYIEGVALYRMGDYRGAAISLRAAAESGGISRDRAWKALGDTHAADGNLDRAVAAYAEMSNRSTIPGLDRLDNVLSRAEQVGDTLLAAEVLEVLRGIAEDTEADPTIDVRLARAMVLGGESEEGIELARELMTADPPPDPVGMIGLVRALQLYAPELGREMLASIATRTESIELLASQAAIMARTGEPAEARAMIQREIDARDPASALPYRRAMVRLLDDLGTDDATQAAARLSDDYPDKAAAQLSALRTSAIWRDLDAAQTAITRLRDTVGENSLAWQTFSARAVIEGDPTDAALSEALGENGLGKVLLEAPNDFDALVLAARGHRMIAERHAEEGRRDEASRSIDLAASYYDRAAGRGLRAFAFMPYIEMLREEGRTVEAERALDRFASITELDREARFQRRQLMLRAGRYSEAADDQRELAGYSEPDSVLALASMHNLAGEDREAVAVLDDFLAQKDWDDEYVEAAADLLADAGAIARSLEVFNTLPDPYNGIPRDAVIARALTRVGRPRDALPYQIAAAREMGTLDAWLSAIRVAGALGDDAKLDEVISEASSAFPNAPEIAAYGADNPLRAFTLGVATQPDATEGPGGEEFRAVALAHGRGEIGNAELLERLAAICEQYPDLLQAWRTRVEANFMLGRIEECVSIASSAADAQPESPGALRLLAETLREAGMSERAIAPAERLVELTRDDPYRATIILAMLEADVGNFERTIELLAGYRDRLEADSLERPNPGLTALAVAFAGIGNAPEASSLFASRLDRSAGGPNALDWQSAAMLATQALPPGRTEARREWLAMITADRLAAQRANQYIALASFSGRAADARSALEIIDAHGNPSDPNWLWVRSQAEDLAGQPDAAEATLETIARMEPEMPITYAGLGELLAGLEGRAEDALSALDRAERLLAGRPTAAGAEGLPTAISVSRARALLALGEPKNALLALEPVLQLENPPANGLAIAGRSYLELGDRQAASEMMARAQDAGTLDARTSAELEALTRRLN